MSPSIEQLEPNIPNMGIRLVYEEGDVCEVTRIPRKTIIKLPCSNSESQWNENQKQAHNIYPRKAYEGKKKEICHYFVEFPPSKYGCPMEQDVEVPSHSSSSLPQALPSSGDVVQTEEEVNVLPVPLTLQPPPPPPEILAVTGCQDSIPARTTKDCHFAGQVRLVLHGRHFHTAFCKSEGGASTAYINTKCRSNFGDDVAVFVGDVRCDVATLISQYQINCTIVNGVGSQQDVVAKMKDPLLDAEWRVMATLEEAVSFKERVNYRERFGKFVEHGVGGMKREIGELYRRAFASRGKNWCTICDFFSSFFFLPFFLFLIFPNLVLVALDNYNRLDA